MGEEIRTNAAGKEVSRQPSHRGLFQRTLAYLGS